MQRKEIKTIPAGSFWVGSRCDLRLEAFLGTCVGVAAYDAEACVGGLIHLLLPEPPQADSHFQREKYATTGLPLFWEALQARGASAATMQACLAGGALVGPIAAQDLNLDIGGRTCEKVLAFLAQAGIAIERYETGGFQPTQIGLDMARGTFSITPSAAPGAPDDSGPPVVPGEDDIRHSIRGLQPIPQVALRVLRMVTEEDCRVSELARMVRQDQVICARTLKLCNAAAFTRPGKIDSLEHALVFLGQERFMQSVIAVCVQDFFRQQGSGYSLRMGGMYQHAVGTALVAEHVSRRSRRISPAVAYTGGLLHDIGKVVLDQYVAPCRPLLYRDLASHTDFLAAEERYLGINHAAAGRQLAIDWGLPASFVDVIAHHHHPEKARHDSDLAHIVHVADLIMACFFTGGELDGVDTAHLAERFATCELEAADLQTIVADLPDLICSPALA